MSFLGDALGPIISTVGGLFGASKQQSSAKELVQLQSKLQRENWEYAQTHAHQFETQDLRDAGLNPILSANHSQLASMPAVSSATGPSSYGNLGSNIASAMQAAMHNDIEKGKLENDKLRLGLESDRLALERERNAADISFKEKQMDQIDQQMSIALKDYDIRQKLASADMDVKKAAAFELGARANEAMAHSDLYYTQRQEIAGKIKYGYLIASYLPQDMRDYAYNNIVTWVDAHKEDIDKFISKGGMSSSDPHKLAYDLFVKIHDMLPESMQSKGRK